MARIYPLPGHHTAIRHGDVLLAVPPLHPASSRATRVQVFELVLRRLFGEAYDLAASTWAAAEGAESARARLASLLQETPHRNARNYQTAA